MKTIIYGASDDLIEIDGAVNDEIDAPHNGKSKFEVSDGTKGTIEYAPGHDAVWSIVMKHEGTLFNRIVRGDSEDDGNIHFDPEVIGIARVGLYSDVLILNDGVEWVKVNGKKFKTHVK